MPLTPFVFQYIYSKEHQISLQAVTLASSTYCFASAFGTKYRSYSLMTIVGGFILAGIYGSINPEQKTDYLDISCLVIYFVFIVAVFERIHRHFYENEICQFYKKFNPK